MAKRVAAESNRRSRARVENGREGALGEQPFLPREDDLVERPLPNQGQPRWQPMIPSVIRLGNDSARTPVWFASTESGDWIQPRARWNRSPICSLDVARRRSRPDLNRDPQQRVVTVVLDEHLGNHKPGAREVAPEMRTVAVLAEGEPSEAGEDGIVIANEPRPQRPASPPIPGRIDRVLSHASPRPTRRPRKRVSQRVAPKVSRSRAPRSWRPERRLHPVRTGAARLGNRVPFARAWRACATASSMPTRALDRDRSRLSTVSHCRRSPPAPVTP